VGERFGSVDLIVNNAGTVAHTTLAETTLAEWQRMMDVNVTSMYLVTRALLDAVADGGSIVNVGSGIALRGLAGRTHYTAAKAAAIGLTRALAHELGPRGIRVNVVAPGITDTGAEIPPERRLQYEQRTPLRRIATPEDIANAVLFLACDLSGFVTGQVIEVNGGI
jgi:3-oxoacyl-[acyl-carrier protein] reductase